MDFPESQSRSVDSTRYQIFENCSTLHEDVAGIPLLTSVNRPCLPKIRIIGVGGA
jgi:hypothetical protein